MKKPTNRTAVFVWVIAALNLIAQAIAEPLIQSWTVAVAPEYQRPDATVHLVFLLQHMSSARGGIVISTMLLALGAIVEILDKIRWDAAQKTK